MKTLEQAIKSLIKDLGIETKVLENQVLNVWSIVVGKRISETPTKNALRKNRCNSFYGVVCGELS